MQEKPKETAIARQSDPLEAEETSIVKDTARGVPSNAAWDGIKWIATWVSDNWQLIAAPGSVVTWIALRFHDIVNTSLGAIFLFSMASIVRRQWAFAREAIKSTKVIEGSTLQYTKSIESVLASVHSVKESVDSSKLEIIASNQAKIDAIRSEADARRMREFAEASQKMIDDFLRSNETQKIMQESVIKALRDRGVI